MTESSSQNRYLIIVRAGDGSLHREWIHPASYRNFDLAISYYGGTPGRYAEECEIYTQAKGAKWPAIYDLIQHLGEQVFQYDAVWFPDDDIRTHPGNIARMFQLFTEHELLLAQPALSANSYFQVTAQHIDYRLRYTQFVEIMVPIFSREALRTCWTTFNKSVTGWGMEHVWAKLLGYPHEKLAILDETPVKHTRPPGQGELYENIKTQLKINPADPEHSDVWSEHGIVAPAPEEITYYGGIREWDPYAALEEMKENAVQENQTASKVLKIIRKRRKISLKRKPARTAAGKNTRRMYSAPEKRRRRSGR